MLSDQGARPHPQARTAGRARSLCVNSPRCGCPSRWRSGSRNGAHPREPCEDTRPPSCIRRAPSPPPLLALPPPRPRQRASRPESSIGLVRSLAAERNPERAPKGSDGTARWDRRQIPRASQEQHALPSPAIAAEGRGRRRGRGRAGHLPSTTALLFQGPLLFRFACRGIAGLGFRPLSCPESTGSWQSPHPGRSGCARPLVWAIHHPRTCSVAKYACLPPILP